MVSVFKKKNSEYSKMERIFTSLFSFIVFGFVGGIVRLVSAPISLRSGGEILLQFLPYVISFGLTSAILAFFFPKPFQIAMCFLPVPGGNS